MKNTRKNSMSSLNGIIGRLGGVYNPKTTKSANEDNSVDAKSCYLANDVFLSEENLMKLPLTKSFLEKKISFLNHVTIEKRDNELLARFAREVVRYCNYGSIRYSIVWGYADGNLGLYEYYTHIIVIEKEADWTYSNLLYTVAHELFHAFECQNKHLFNNIIGDHINFYNSWKAIELRKRGIPISQYATYEEMEATEFRFHDEEIQQEERPSTQKFTIIGKVEKRDGKYVAVMNNES